MLAPKADSVAELVFSCQSLARSDKSFTIVQDHFEIKV